MCDCRVSGRSRRSASPDRIDWIDYAERHESASVAGFAASVVERAGNSDVWLVLSLTHPPTQAACGSLAAALQRLRPVVEVSIPDDAHWHEHDSLLRFRPQQ